MRGVGANPPPGGYPTWDIVFFGHGGGDDGHVALYLGGGDLVQCSSSGDGSNIRPMAGYAAHADRVGCDGSSDPPSVHPTPDPMSTHKKLPSGKLTWEVRWRDSRQHSRNFDRKRDADALDSGPPPTRPGWATSTCSIRAVRPSPPSRASGGRSTRSSRLEPPKTRKVYGELWDKHVLDQLGPSSFVGSRPR